jgi:hypothetical protein
MAHNAKILGQSVRLHKIKGKRQPRDREDLASKAHNNKVILKAINGRDQNQKMEMEMQESIGMICIDYVQLVCVIHQWDRKYRVMLTMLQWKTTPFTGPSWSVIDRIEVSKLKVIMQMAVHSQVIKVVNQIKTNQRMV